MHPASARPFAPPVPRLVAGEPDDAGLQAPDHFPPPGEVEPPIVIHIGHNADPILQDGEPQAPRLEPEPLAGPLAPMEPPNAMHRRGAMRAQLEIFFPQISGDQVDRILEVIEPGEVPHLVEASLLRDAARRFVAGMLYDEGTLSVGAAAKGFVDAPSQRGIATSAAMALGALAADAITRQGRLGPQYSQSAPATRLSSCLGSYRAIPGVAMSAVVELGIAGSSAGAKAMTYLVGGVATSLLGQAIVVGARDRLTNRQTLPVWLLEENPERLMQHVAHLRQGAGTAVAGYLRDAGRGLLGATMDVRLQCTRRDARTLLAAGLVAAGYALAPSGSPILTLAAAAAAPLVWALVGPAGADNVTGVPAAPGGADGIVPQPRAGMDGAGVEGQPWQPFQGEGRRLDAVERGEGQPAGGEPDPFRLGEDDEPQPGLRPA